VHSKLCYCIKCPCATSCLTDAEEKSLSTKATGKQTCASFINTITAKGNTNITKNNSQRAITYIPLDIKKGIHYFRTT